MQYFMQKINLIPKHNPHGSAFLFLKSAVENDQAGLNQNNTFKQ